MSKTNPKVDAYFNRPNAWLKEMKKLRAIMLDNGLTEELKWGKPCYTFNDNNIVILQSFKAFCAALFVKGALIKDPKKLLKEQGKNTQSAKRLEFSDSKQIDATKTAINAIIRDAIRVEKSGDKVVFKKQPEPIPDELQTALNKNKKLKQAFAALTPGRQRGYILQISAAKQSETRASRVEKFIPKILAGKGIQD